MAGRRRSTNSRADPHVSKAHAYAQAVVDGDVPACKWVRLACARQLADLKRKFPYTFSPEAAGRVCRFIEQLPHVKGPKAGELIELEPWQCFILCTVFGWIGKNGKRRFRRAYIEVPRGNAKSTLSSGIALYAVAADGEQGGEVYSAATTRDQARIVFRDAQQMLRKRPGLRDTLRVEVLAHNINQVHTASKFEPLSADAESLEGKNVHFGIIDELHAHKTREVYDVIETGTGKRDQSLLWCITTAGSDRSGICYEVRGYCLKVLEGLASDDSQFTVIYSTDESDDWTAESSWIKANPNWGISVRPEIVAQLCNKAMQMPAAQANFKTKHLDVWVNADAAWMPMEKWDACGDKTLRLCDLAGETCTIGLDLASKTDMAVRVLLFRKTIDNILHYYVFGTYYLPEAAVHDGRNSQYSGWEIAGRLIVTSGDVLDFDRVLDDLVSDVSTLDVESVGYDPWQAAYLAQKLVQQNAPMVEFRNTVGNFSAPMKELEALVRAGRLHHDGDPVMAWMVSNVVCHLDAKENIYPRKERPENKIDGVIALIMALGRAMAADQDVNPYETRGIRMI